MKKSEFIAALEKHREYEPCDVRFDAYGARPTGLVCCHFLKLIPRGPDQPPRRDRFWICGCHCKTSDEKVAKYQRWLNEWRASQQPADLRSEIHTATKDKR